MQHPTTSSSKRPNGIFWRPRWVLVGDTTLVNSSDGSLADRYHGTRPCSVLNMSVASLAASDRTAFSSERMLCVHADLSRVMISLPAAVCILHWLQSLIQIYTLVSYSIQALSWSSFWFPAVQPRRDAIYEQDDKYRHCFPPLVWYFCSCRTLLPFHDHLWYYKAESSVCEQLVLSGYVKAGFPVASHFSGTPACTQRVYTTLFCVNTVMDTRRVFLVNITM